MTLFALHLPAGLLHLCTAAPWDPDARACVARTACGLAIEMRGAAVELHVGGSVGEVAGRMAREVEACDGCGLRALEGAGEATK